ncbi:MAG: elongation factor P, partial [Elusimicrobiales bacterium]|nr:elongation factor P [Elusimicrobiales bacterium]
NMDTGSVIETSYRPEDKFKDVDVEKRPKTYMYTENGKAFFMDDTDFDQLELPVEKLGDTHKFLAENMHVEGLYINDKFYNILLPAKVEFKVQSTVPGVKGDSVSNMTKPATLVNGTEVKVPLFVNEGDTIRVDTRTGQYVDRV